MRRNFDPRGRLKKGAKLLHLGYFGAAFLQSHVTYEWLAGALGIILAISWFVGEDLEA